MNTIFKKSDKNLTFILTSKWHVWNLAFFLPLTNYPQLIFYCELIYIQKQCSNNIPWVFTISESKNPLWPTVLGQWKYILQFRSNFGPILARNGSFLTLYSNNFKNLQKILTQGFKSCEEMALFGSLGQYKCIWLFRFNFGTILAFWPKLTFFDSL